MRILFLGDVVGRPGRRAVQQCLPSLKETHAPDFTIVNAENAAAGFGITCDMGEEIFKAGADAITLGNHAFHHRDSYDYIKNESRIARPANLPPGTPGTDVVELHNGGHSLKVINLCGRIFMGEYDDPFRAADRLIEQAGTNRILIDFHAEATSEKAAFANYVDGRVSAVVGTHTHVQTADERILPQGTAFISDVGMCGPQDSVIGMDKQIIIRKFLTQMPERFLVAEGPSMVSAVIIDVGESGTAVGIERIAWTGIQ
jgi:metallophosphoesterase (TIGR00282 family)